MAYSVEPRQVDPLVVGRVIGDVVDMFVPAVSMSVYYGPKHVTNGCDIKPSMTTAPPTVHISGYADDLNFGCGRYSGGTHAVRGKEILTYMGPSPPVGIHRYVLVLFRQKNSLNIDEPPEIRANFSTRNFANQLDLGLPAATVYFNAQKKPMTKRR
ncbi:hypothetical protein IFM89_019261 [Coptis chinensis]|uniref:Uncharacterized protein n=1 Tax=Coptis chinensis TaxID=261450 RepID=A0A835LHS1_9MAGN|nr:hypothetical protein IFM89_019261 [Coptis chinensis]